MSISFTKLLRDVIAERGRVGLMVTAIALSLVAVGTVLGAAATLTREIAVNYQSTRPADATVEFAGDVDASVVAAAAAVAGVVDAEARDVVVARVRVGDAWRPLLLFVFDDFAKQRLNTVRLERGAWPRAGELLIERSAVAVVGPDLGGEIDVRLDSDAWHALHVSGVVHDPGLAPAGQERTGYGYIDRATLKMLGAAPVLHELRLRFDDVDPALDVAARMTAAEGRANAVVRAVAGGDRVVHQIRVPPPGHPHQRQMSTILLLLMVFSALALVLSAILVATSLAAMLARQVREIGVMKTLGARPRTIAALYAGLVASIGTVASLIALPLSLWWARALSGVVGRLLNFDLTDAAAPAWVSLVVVAAGVGVPLLVAAVPITSASRQSVRSALDAHGTGGGTLAARLAILPAPLRSALRRPLRFALTVAVLAAGGAMFIAAINASQSWQRNLEKVGEARHYDLDIKVRGRPDGAADVARRVAGVVDVEAWGFGSAAVAHEGRIDVVRTYPDRGHGSLVVMAPPAQTRMVDFPLLAGRWLRDDDREGCVVSHGALAQLRGVNVGDTVDVSVEGNVGHFVVRGVVEEIGASGVIYVSRDAFAFAGSDVAVVLRMKTSAHDDAERGAIANAVEAALGADAGAVVEAVVPLSELRAAIGGHVEILIRLLLAMAFIMGLVGVLALASTMGIAVLERSREFGVMMAVGAVPAQIARRVVAEAVSIGVVSGVVGVVVAVPLTLLLDALLGNLGFLAALPWAFSGAAVAGWFVVVVVGSIIATLVPASRIGATGVREALASV